MFNEILREDKFLFFGYGRTALEFGYYYLGLEKGNEILYPDYICDVTVLPANKLGINIKYYKITDSLEPDFEDVTRLLTPNTKAFLAVNYFGFPQPFKEIKTFCKQHGLFFIENNSHSFLSQKDGNYLGTFGDIGVLSFRKLIPLVNGAALIINMGKNDSFNLIKNKTKSLLYERELNRKLKCSVQRFCRKMNFDLGSLIKRKLNIPEAGSTENEDLHYRIDRSSLKILSKYNLRLEKKRRKTNYHKIVQLANKELIPVFNELPKGIIPQACPFYSNNRNKWLKILISRGMNVYTWPTLPLAVAEHLSNANEKWSSMLVVGT